MLKFNFVFHLCISVFANSKPLTLLVPGLTASEMETLLRCEYEVSLGLKLSSFSSIEMF